MIIRLKLMGLRPNLCEASFAIFGYRKYSNCDNNPAESEPSGYPPKNASALFGSGRDHEPYFPLANNIFS